MSVREIAQGKKRQGENESLAYKITTTNWASSPSDPVVGAFLYPLLSGVTSDVFPINTPTCNGDIITLSPLKNLAIGNTYRIEVRFTSGVNTWECYFRVQCDK